MTDPVHLANAVLPDGRRVDVVVADGCIAAIVPPGAPSQDGMERVDCGRCLLAPSFCEGHIHLDKTFAGIPFVRHRRGTSVAERIAAEKTLRREVDTSVFDRGATLIRQAVGFGTGQMRTHVDIDPDVGLANLHEVLRLRDAFADVVDLQIVAFPQSGIVRAPGVADLMDAALREGATHIGGLDPVGIDDDMAGHLDVVFGLAEKHGVGVDIHLHDGGETGLTELRDIAARTRALGLAGQVVVSHAFALGEPLAIGPTVTALREAGVAVLTNGPGPVLMPPVVRLWSDGVKVLAGSDNIRDAWSPYGDGDMLRRATMIGYRQGMNAEEELSLLFDIVTMRTASAMGWRGHRLGVGADANLVLIDAPGISEAVAAAPPRILVMKHGRIVARDGVFVD